MLIRFVDAIDRPDTLPGDAKFYTALDGTAPAGLVFNCPGCGQIGVVRFRNGHDSKRPSWTWDGNRERPTLTPSIHCVGCCGWHGYLRAGEFQPC